jgi:AAA+ ATPase superfamily predicted ATPase
MAETKFVGRNGELELLDNLWETTNATLLILYGRRRVGKTRLLTHWMKHHSDQAIYWVAEPTSALDQLRSFSQALYNHTTPDTPAPLDFTYANWEQALRQVALLAGESRLALVIDELPYLMAVNPTITGTLQKTWDQWLSKANLILALSGSQMGLMQEMLSYQEPLYGRATAQLRLPPMPYGDTREFFPDYRAKDRVAVYSIWGGVPAYWERLDASASIVDNVRTQLLPANTLMQEEPGLLLRDFISDPHNYVGIMRAIAGGANTQKRIASRTGLAKGHISKYLSVLRNTGFVARQVPVTEEEAKSRRGRYFVTDPYLRFYYRFFAAYQAKLALGEQQQILSLIEQALPEFIQDNTWRELCREWLLRASSQGEIPVPVEQVGGAWARNYECDVVGISKEENSLVLGTCLWNSEPADLSVIQDLVMTTPALVPQGGQWSVYYLGFASGGWTEEASSYASSLMSSGVSGKNWLHVGARLLDLDKLDSDLIRWSTAANYNQARLI